MRKVLAIDPGNAKCGVAVVSKDQGKTHIVHREVCETAQLKERLPEIVEQHTPTLVVVGDGTNTKRVQTEIRQALPGHALLILDERDTSLQARERYWEYSPRRGWRRLLPSSLQVPPVPIDDFVAVILAEKALSAE